MAVQTVTAPTRQPRERGLKSIAEFDEDARIGASEVLAYEALPCGLPQGTVALCWEDLGARVPKDGTDAGWGESIFPPFAQYAGASCYINDDDNFAEQARMVLEGGEEDLIVEKIDAWVTAEGTALTAQASATLALAEVEEALRDGYRGRGTILVSAYTATLLDAGGALKQKDGEIMTVTGSRVGIVAGVPKTGVIGMGAIKVVHSPMREYQAADHRANLDLAIAERIYTVLVDCDFAVRAAVTP